VKAIDDMSIYSDCQEERLISSNKEIEDESWDYLIILDACRFDYFSQIYGNYLVGKLTKRISSGSSTPDWFRSTFKRPLPDVLYVSGNPFINGSASAKGLQARRFFSKVIDVWEFGWNQELGTVHPQEINKAVLDTIRDFPSKRLIIHYVQPHAPYISTDFRTGGFVEPNIESEMFLVGQASWSNSFRRRLYYYADSLGILLTKIGIIRDEWAVRELVGMLPAGPMDAARRRYGREGIRRAYKENLEIALCYVRELCRSLLEIEPSKKIIVTSDHGELLGEKGIYSHKAASKDPTLLEVPWFEVSGLVKAAKSCPLT
jgi:hypothetical protein